MRVATPDWAAGGRHGLPRAASPGVTVACTSARKLVILSTWRTVIIQQANSRKSGQVRAVVSSRVASFPTSHYAL
jgi:hypothetical protein